MPAVSEPVNFYSRLNRQLVRMKIRDLLDCSDPEFQPSWPRFGSAGLCSRKVA